MVNVRESNTKRLSKVSAEMDEEIRRTLTKCEVISEMNEVKERFYERIQEELNLKSIKDAQKVYRFYSSIKGVSNIISEDELYRLIKLALSGSKIIQDDRRYKG